MSAVWFLFDKAEETLKDSVRQSISNWLRNANPKPSVARWPTYFARVFDSIFTEKHRSWRCFRRSCIASITATSIVTIVWASLRPSSLSYTLSEIGDNVILLGLLLPVLVVWNMFVDYLSLLETRVLIRMMSDAGSSARVVVLLIVDLIVTGMIFVIGVFLSLLPFYLWAALVYGGLDPSIILDWFALVVELLLNGPTLDTASIGNYPSLGILIYSTFFTSVWLWAVCSAFFLISFLRGSYSSSDEYITKSLYFMNEYINFWEHLELKEVS